MIYVECGCGSCGRVPARYAGRTVRCSRCREPLTVPRADGESAPGRRNLLAETRVRGVAVLIRAAGLLLAGSGALWLSQDLDYLALVLAGAGIAAVGHLLDSFNDVARQVALGAALGVLLWDLWLVVYVADSGLVDFHLAGLLRILMGTGLLGLVAWILTSPGARQICRADYRIPAGEPRASYAGSPLFWIGLVLLLGPGLLRL